MSAIARLSWTAIDCPEPRRLAEFYSAVLGWPIDEDRSDAEWVELEADTGATISFQQVADYSPPQWPGQLHPQQLHLDLAVPDLDVGEAEVLALGATKHDFQPGRIFRVFLDPAGHPFCLIHKP
jgi:predicted enzyme related to lactoylglutathione lyase